MSSRASSTTRRPAAVAVAVAVWSAVDRALAWPLRLLVWLYRRLLSPLLPPACRFYPSCSAYADEALARRGLVRGGLLTARRLCRCHPWAEGGFDPVPNGRGSCGQGEVAQHDQAGQADQPRHDQGSPALCREIHRGRPRRPHEEDACVRT